jgi:hypothetical protein
MLKPVVAATLVGVALFTGAAAASTKNDRVLHEDRYVEVFKQEGHGDKNYLYTITEFTDRFGRDCTVVTGASESAIALQCGLAGNG